MLQVKKRNGQVVPFDEGKIYSAVTKAFVEVRGEGIINDSTREHIALYTATLEASEKDVVDIEDIQDNVERILMMNAPDVAKAYILYRDKRASARAEKTFKTIASKLRAEAVENQNANVDEHSFGGRMGEATRVVTKEYALNNCMSKMARNNHLNNEIYIHDLDSYAVGSHNCLSLPLDDLLKNGVKTRQTSIRTAGSLNTAMQLVAVYMQLQSLQMFGGVSATHLDWTMVPYVRKSFVKHYETGLKYICGVHDPKEYHDTYVNKSIEDHTIFSSRAAWDYAYDMTVKETKQAAEGLIHNLKFWVIEQ